jgi:hypothetical protein
LGKFGLLDHYRAGALLKGHKRIAEALHENDELLKVPRPDLNYLHIAISGDELFALGVEEWLDRGNYQHGVFAVQSTEDVTKVVNLLQKSGNYNDLGV